MIADKRATAFVAISITVVVAVGLVAFASPSGPVSQGQTSLTTTPGSCTLALSELLNGGPDYPAGCGAPLSFEAFQQFVSRSTSIGHEDGGIVLTVGYHPCTIWFYVLPNDTDVIVNLGAANATQFCA